MRVTDVLDRCILLGAPGIGKTAIVEQYARQKAKELSKKFIDLKRENDLKRVLENPEKYFTYLRIVATHIFPEDCSIPRDEGKYLVFKSPLTLKVLEQTQGIIFIDEINNVKREDQRVLFYSMIQEKEIGWNLKLSDEQVIICAGNPPEYSADASNLPNPLLNRMTVFEVDPPTIDEWIQYMKRFDHDTRVDAYLKYNEAEYGGGAFLKVPEEPEGLENFPSPRSWTNLALKSYKINDDRLLPVIAAGCVGKEEAGKFVAFVKTNVPTIEDLLEKPALWDSLDLQGKYLVTSAMANKIMTLLKNKKFDKVLDHVENEFIVIMLKLIPIDTRIYVLKHPTLSAIIKKLAKELKDFF
jgi:hypothetical protein